MKICIINPNTTAAFTTRLLQSAHAIAAPDTEVITVQPSIGAASIESHAEEALGALGVMQMVAEREKTGVDAYVIACFGDTGLHQAREMARGPVVGMTEAALQAASLVAHRFSIVTLPPRTRAHSLRVLQDTGLSHRCTIRAVEVPVLDLEDDVAASGPIIEAEARLAIEQDHAEAIILGCAGLSNCRAPEPETRYACDRWRHGGPEIRRGSGGSRPPHVETLDLRLSSCWLQPAEAVLAIA